MRLELYPTASSLPPILETRVVQGVTWARLADRDALNRRVDEDGFDPETYPQWIVIAIDPRSVRSGIQERRQHLAELVV